MPGDWNFYDFSSCKCLTQKKNGVGFCVDPDTGDDLTLFDESHYRMIREKNPDETIANNITVPLK